MQNHTYIANEVSTMDLASGTANAFRSLDIQPHSDYDQKWILIHQFQSYYVHHVIVNFSTHMNLFGSAMVC